MKTFRDFLRKRMMIFIVLVFVLLFPGSSKALWIHSLVINLSDADWTLVGEENGDWTAYFASPAGDVNGDGLGDAFIGAPMAGEKECPYPLNPDGSCPGLLKGKGVAYLVLGRDGALTPDPLNLAEADASFLGCEVNSMTARQLYTAGDVNGDGYDDILISGWKCGENYRGKAYLFLGREDVSTWENYFPVEQADASFLGENEWDFLSYYVSTAGDVNADGFDDFLITSTHHEYDEPCPPAAPDECTSCCKNFTGSTEIYNPIEDSWMISGNLTTERMNHTTTIKDGSILVVGGQNADNYLASSEIFDPETLSWDETGALNMPRSNHAMSDLANGNVLVIGGENSNGYLDSAEIFDYTTGTWNNTGRLNAARSAHTATFLQDGRILVVGGQSTDGFLKSVEVYDPNTESWSFWGQMSFARANHTATLLPDGHVLVTGGENESGQLNSAEVFDPTPGAWTTTENMLTARTFHTATLLPDENKVLIAGGRNANNLIFETELLDLNTLTWTNTGSLNNARTNHTATYLPDGRVIVIGGQNNSGSLLSYEFYSPITATWTMGTQRSMNNPRADHSAVLLSSEQVLVAGGRQCTNLGKVYLILGRQSADWGIDFDLSQADASFLGEATEDRLGRSATGVGDVNGDGYADFLIGSIGSDDAGEDAGQNYLFLGRATIEDPMYDPTRPWWGNDFPAALADASFVGEAPGDESGRRVAWAGDINGDGLDDMLMQSALNDYSGLDAGIAYIVLGSRAADWGLQFSLAKADASFVGENKRDQAGRRVSGAGDVNDDGFDDFLVGAPHNEDGSLIPGIIAGKSYLIYGRAETDWGNYYPLSQADVIHVGKPDIGVAGYDNAWLKDFNGDGIDDYLIAAYGGRNNEHIPGEAYILSGSASPVPTQFLPDYPFDLPDDGLVRFTGEFWDPNGWQDIQTTELIVDDQTGLGYGFKVRYDQVVNGFYLFDPIANNWLGPCTPEVNGQLNNHIVQLECLGSRIYTDENHAMRVLWRIRWLQLPPKEIFDIYLRSVDKSGNDSQPVSFGIWPVSGFQLFLPTIFIK